jgi:hypothetical protein
MGTNKYEVEACSDHFCFDIEIEYEYDPGSPGSYHEPPDPDQVNIIEVKCKIPFDELHRLEDLLKEYEREGGGRYNPADDQ